MTTNGLAYSGGPWRISPNIERARPAREKQVAAPTPRAAPPKNVTRESAHKLFFTEVHDYDGLRDAVRARVEQLNISRQCLDEITGPPTGYCSKVLAQGEAKDVKRFGVMSLGLVLQAAGLKMVLDPAALAKYRPLFVERQAHQARPGNHSRKTKGKRAPKKYVPKRRTSQR
jgi:hypothetical protein